MNNEELDSTANRDAKSTTGATQSLQPNVLNESVRRHARLLADGKVLDMSKWLSTLTKLYDDRKYTSSQRISNTLSILSAESVAWYEQHKEEIHDDWTLFCEQLQQFTTQQKTNRSNNTTNDPITSNFTPEIDLEEFIDANFTKYSAIGDAKSWLLQTMNQFRIYGLRRDDQFEAISSLLEGEAYIWYAEHADEIHNFETFSKLLLQHFKNTTLITIESPGGTATKVVTVPEVPSALHLQRTLADEIIKRPTYFHGSQNDVHDWLDKLEQRFTMAQWNDEIKLQYISIHLQDDAYRWWMQTSSTIKTWSTFKDAVIRAFGSTRMQELAFEQLKWYKQTISQSITQYYDKIIELCRKVDPTMPDSLKLKYLMAGIKESLKTHVALEDPKTSEAFLLSARKIEDILALTNGNNEVIPNDATLNLTNYQGPPSQTSQLNHPQPNNNNNLNRNKSQSSSTQRNQLSQRNKHWKSKRSKQRSNACFNCGALGHYARDCTRPHFQ